jgi:hypothetical protein
MMRSTPNADCYPCGHRRSDNIVGIDGTGPQNEPFRSRIGASRHSAAMDHSAEVWTGLRGLAA